MSYGPIYASPIARAVPFDNTSNGFTATDVQAAIEEATKRLNTLQVTATGLVSTTSATFSTVTGMTLQPPAGTWIGIYTGFFYTQGVNVQAEVTAVKNAAEITYARRIQYDNAAILGLVTLSTNEGGSSAALAFRETFNGTDTVSIQFREVAGGTAYMRERSLILLQVTP